METIEYHTQDKSEWTRGPWDHEPDKVQYPDAETGPPCLIVRNPGGALCGYVGVSTGHPAFKRSYGAVDVDVHWGLTYADQCRPHGDEEGRGICHVPSAGEPDHVWWLGFDCAHSGDFTPSGTQYGHLFEQGQFEQYRDIDFVKRHVRNIARQLADMQP
jgi:hypothetical protein